MSEGVLQAPKSEYPLAYPQWRATVSVLDVPAEVLTEGELATSREVRVLFVHRLRTNIIELVCCSMLLTLRSDDVKDTMIASTVLYI